jgi:hypothetical protein
MIEMIGWFKDTEDIGVSDVEKGIKEAASAFSGEERREYGSAFTAFCLSQGLEKNVIDDGGENIPPLSDVLRCSINELTGSSLAFSVRRARALINAMESDGYLPENEWRPAKTACLMRHFLEKRDADRGKNGLEWVYDTEFDAMKAGGFFQVFCATTGLDYAALFPAYSDKIDYVAIGSENGGSPNGGAGVGAFSVKDGRTLKNGKEIDCEVHEVPPNLKDGIKTWAALSETSEISGEGEVTEAEAGVWFFAADGKPAAFLPLDAADGASVIFSPDGERFLLETGPQYLPEAAYGVYETAGLEKKAEIDGVKGAVWIDPIRFVMTRIDDAHDIPEPAFVYRVSVVMYDTAASETVVLKESTDTKNYWLDEVIEEGAALSVREQSVESPDDWADEEKIGTREITVPIPPAG